MDNILIHKPVLEDTKLTSKVSVPNKLAKYIRNKELFIEYDEEIHFNESILSIPLTATMLPFAWLTGYDLEVETIDETFLESMKELKQVFKKIHPSIPFTSKIIANKIVKNRIDYSENSERYGLLFSGGIDSTYSMLTNLDKSPILVMLWGVDNFPYPENSEQWGYIYSEYSKVASKLNLEIHLVKTNASQILESGRIDHDYHKMLHDGSFRALIQHSLLLLPLTAPLSLNRFNRLLIASSGEQSQDFETPWGSTKEIDEKIIWADLKVKHDGEIDRARKITGKVKDIVIMNQIPLRVCLRRLNQAQLNDSTCEKCLRTIASLTLAEVNPNICGFQVDETTFTNMKHKIENEKIDNDFVAEWGPIQKLIPDNIEFDIYGSREFFTWFKDFDLNVKTGLEKPLREFYYILPYKYAKQMDNVYRKFGINIHEASPKRESFKQVVT